MRALEAGKHVLCEKPMSSDPLAVAAVFDVADFGAAACGVHGEDFAAGVGINLPVLLGRLRVQQVRASLLQQ